MSKDNQAKFIDKNAKRKFYLKGIIELINTPDIAPGPKANPLSDPPDINNLKSAKSPAISSTPATPSTGVTSPPTVRKPFKVSSGTPVKRAISTDNLASVTPLNRIKSEPSKTPATLPVHRSRRGSKGSIDEIASPPVFSTPQTSSRSGRVIKQSKRFDDENSTISSTEATARTADTQIDDPRKIWVKRRSTGDLIEIRLTMERPTEWQSEKQKLMWNLATARNACKLKELVELGQYIPKELIQELQEKAALTDEEKEDLRKVAEQSIRREKMEWLMREHKMVDTECLIRKALPTKDPDTDECVRLLQKLLFMDIEKFMLVKQPTLADTVDKLKNYKGPKVKEENIDNKEWERIQRNIISIQTMAATLHKKLQALFHFKETAELSFYKFLLKEAKSLKEKTKGMAEKERLALTEPPK